MLDCQDFYAMLRDAGVGSYAGVPDSLLKDFCAYVTDNVPGTAHVITANEGAAIALSAGRYLASGRVGLVYLQNSGLGNILNPVTSLVDPEVYAIPVLLLVGWRGEPGTKDEPQHVKQGKNMLAILEAASVPYRILPPDPAEARQVVCEAQVHMLENAGPFALVVRKGTFSPYRSQRSRPAGPALTREEAIGVILAGIEDDAIVVSTTGMISREVFEHRARQGAGHQRDFLTVGSMGHASQIALGIALEKPGRPVYCLDGDGALLMHMGSAAVLASLAPINLTHLVLNNGAHDSVGGQPTASLQLDLVGFADAVGYREARQVESAQALGQAMRELARRAGPRFVEVRVARGARPDLGRPTTTPQENKMAFTRYVQGEGG